MKSGLLKFGLIGTVVVLLQVVIFNHLNYEAIRPDIALLAVLWVMATHNRTTALLFAGFVGIFSDFFMDTWGLNMLAKTLAAFIVYPFTPRLEESRLFISQVFILVLAVSLIHNLFFVMAAWFSQVYETQHYFLQILFGGSLYTAIIGSIIYFFMKD